MKMSRLSMWYDGGYCPERGAVVTQRAGGLEPGQARDDAMWYM